MRSRVIPWAIGAGLLCLPALAMAGPPFLTDDADTIDPGDWEINLGSQSEWTRTERDGSAPFADINYGIVTDLQLHVQPSLAYAHHSEEEGHYGWEDTEISLKWRFVHADGGGPEITFYPAIVLPTGNDQLGLGSGQTSVYLPVWVQQSLGAWTTYGGGGYWINPGTGNRDYLFLGWEVQRQITETMYLGAELYYTTPSTVDGSSATGFNVGGGWGFTKNVHLLFSAGHSLGGIATTSYYVATQFDF